MLTAEEKEARKQARHQARQVEKNRARIETEKNQKPVKNLTISIEWKKSRTWGHNPHAEARVEFHDGTYTRRDGYTASGCGYDKESTVIAAVFNDFLLYKLWAITDFQGKPYGISAGNYDGREYRSYEGGIGTSCYDSISRFIGGTFEHVASGKSFDVYRYTDK